MAMPSSGAGIWLAAAFCLLHFSLANGFDASPYKIYGCRYSKSLCTEEEICYNDELFGSCQMPATADPYTFALMPNQRGDLDLALSDLLKRGYTWHDRFTQCLVATLLATYRGIRGVDLSWCDTWKEDTQLTGDSPAFSSEKRSGVQAGGLHSESVSFGGGHLSEHYSGEEHRSVGAGAGGNRLGLSSPSAVQLSPEDTGTLDWFLGLSESEAQVVLQRLVDDGSGVGGAPTRQPSQMAAGLADGLVLKGAAVKSATVAVRGNTFLASQLLAGKISIGDLNESEVDGLIQYLKGKVGKDSPASRSLPANENRDHVARTKFESTGVNPLPDRTPSPSNRDGLHSQTLSPSSSGGLHSSAFPSHPIEAVNKPTVKVTNGDGGHNDDDDDDELPDEISQVTARVLSDVDIRQQLDSLTVPKTVDKGGRVAPDLASDAEVHSSGGDNSQNSPGVSVGTSQNDVWLQFDEEVTLTNASEIVRQLVGLLAKNGKTLIPEHIRVVNGMVVFSEKKDGDEVPASAVVEKLQGPAGLRLSEAVGARLLAAGVGPVPAEGSNGIPDNEDSKPHEAPTNNIGLVILTLVLCGSVVGVVIGVTVVCMFRRYQRQQRDNKLSAPDSNTLAENYEELCRRKMKVKAEGQHGGSSPVQSVFRGRQGSVSPATDGTGSNKGDSCSHTSPSPRSNASSTSSWSEEPVSMAMDITTGHMVLSYMEDHLKNQDRIDSEWSALVQYEAEGATAEIALKGENAGKNRYADYLPYDHSRVMLNRSRNINGSDYINASYITDADLHSPAYIASQAPLSHTVCDFWQMIWEQSCVTIVMLSPLTEGESVMSHRFWPTEGSELYHVYEVHLVSEHVWCKEYLVRSFYLKNIETNESRTVTMFDYHSWPREKIPSSPKALLDCRRKVNKSFRKRSSPVVVVCGDGCGPSASFILLDMVIGRLSKGAKEIDIAATVEHLRDQRPKVIRTKAQFQFVLSAMAEEVQAILKPTKDLKNQ